MTHAIPQASESRVSPTITLKRPITIEGATITTITLREPKVRDYKNAQAAGADELSQTIIMIANLAQIPPSAVEDMHLADLGKCSEVLAGFLS